MSYIRPASQVEIAAGVLTDVAVSPKNLKDNVWFQGGNTNGSLKNFGTTDSFDIPFIRGGSELMRLTSTGLGIGLTNPAVKLEVDSGTTDVSGLRLTRLLSTSATSTGGPIGVDANGNIVRISTGGSMSSFTLAGTSGTNQTISDGNTLTIAAGTGITTTGGATDTVTVALNATLDNLTDVVISSPSTNQVVQYNGSNWVNATLTPSAFTLAATSGTNQTITAGDTLTVAAGTGISTTASATDTVTIALNATLDNLSDVIITSPSNGQVVKYNGTNWVNATDTTSATNGLQIVSNNVELGGTLTQSTTTIAMGTNALHFTQSTGAKIGVATASPNSGFDINTSVSVGAITTFTSSVGTPNYTATATDYLILVDAALASSIINLPAATGVARREYVVKKIDSSANTVTLSGATTNIDGASSYVINGQYNAIKVKSNGTQYFIY